MRSRGCVNTATVIPSPSRLLRKRRTKATHFFWAQCFRFGACAIVRSRGNILFGNTDTLENLTHSPQADGFDLRFRCALTTFTPTLKHALTQHLFVRCGPFRMLIVCVCGRCLFDSEVNALVQAGGWRQMLLKFKMGGRHRASRTRAIDARCHNSWWVITVTNRSGHREIAHVSDVQLFRYERVDGGNVNAAAAYLRRRGILFGLFAT